MVYGLLIQSGEDVYPTDEHGDVIYDEQTSIAETWQVRFFTGGQ